MGLQFVTETLPSREEFLQAAKSLHTAAIKLTPRT